MTYNQTETRVDSNVAAGTIGPFTLRGGNYWIETLSSSSGLFTCATNPSPGDTVVIGSVTYRWESTLAQANDVKIGADANTSLAHFVATLNGTGIAGTDYFAGTLSPAAEVTAGAVNTSNHTVLVTAKAVGTAGASITTTSNTSGATWTSSTLTANSGTIDLKKLGPNGSTFTARITQITATVGQQTIALSGGTYEWVIANFAINFLEVTRIPTAVE